MLLRRHGQHRALGDDGYPAADARRRACRRCARRCGRSGRRVRHCHAHWHRDRAAAAPRFRCGWRTAGSRSKPKPGSSGSFSASSRSRNRRSITSRSRHRPAGIDRDGAHRAVGAEETAPPAAARPCPAASIAATSMAARRESVAAITVSVATGSAKALLDDVIRQRLSRADRRIALPSACSSSVVKARRSAR